MREALIKQEPLINEIRVSMGGDISYEKERVGKERVEAHRLFVMTIVGVGVFPDDVQSAPFDACPLGRGPSTRHTLLPLAMIPLPVTTVSLGNSSVKHFCSDPSR